MVIGGYGQKARNILEKIENHPHPTRGGGSNFFSPFSNKISEAKKHPG